MWLIYLRVGLLALIAAGCIWIILTPSDPPETSGAFSLLGIIVAWGVSPQGLWGDPPH